MWHYTRDLNRGLILWSEAGSILDLPFYLIKESKNLNWLAQSYISKLGTKFSKFVWETAECIDGFIKLYPSTMSMLLEETFLDLTQ